MSALTLVDLIPETHCHSTEFSEPVEALLFRIRALNEIFSTPPSSSRDQWRATFRKIVFSADLGTFLGSGDTIPVICDLKALKMALLRLTRALLSLDEMFAVVGAAG